MRAEGDCVNSSRILEHLDAWQGQCLVLTIVVILAIEWLGRNLSLWLVMKAFGTKTARFYDTRVTAIGVIHHELSHLLVAIFTGARIDGVKLYKIFQKQDDEVLGYVNYTPRGLYPFRCIQQTLIGIAPGILGMVQICTMSQLLLGFWSSLGNDCFKHPAIWILAIVMSQIAYHSCPPASEIHPARCCARAGGRGCFVDSAGRTRTNSNHGRELCHGIDQSSDLHHTANYAGRLLAYPERHRRDAKLPDLSENPREGRLPGGTQTLHGTAQKTVRGKRKGLNQQLAPCLHVRRNPHTPPTNASFRTSAVTSVSLVAKSFGRYLYSIANPVHCEVS